MAEKVTFSDSFTTYIQGEARAMASSRQGARLMHTDDMNDLVLMGLARDSAEVEVKRLRGLLQAIELATATGDGLSPDETIGVHALAAKHSESKEDQIMCCAAKEWDKDQKPDGVCPDCDQPTVDGESFEGCYYGSVECETCGWKPCDGSC